MDFNSMKRKELQALCKEHGLPANSTNSQMIESLSSIFQEKIKPKGCLKGSGGSSAEDLGILRGGSKKVTFVIQDEEEDDFEEFTIKPVRISKRKSVGRRSSVAPELEERSEKTEKDGRSESLKDATEVPRRTTRSRGLAEAVLWSPVIEKKKKKKTGDGTEGVRQNAMSKEKGIFGEVHVTRSLRNRAVVVGGDEVSVTDRNSRRTQTIKNSVKKEENDKTAAVSVEDEAAGRKSLRKRSRAGDSVEDEPPPRRSSLAKSEEAVAAEEIDVERPKKRRKGGTETPLIEKVVADDTERISKPGCNAKRSRGNVLDGNAMGSGDVDDVAGQKKARSQRNSRASTQGDSTYLISNGEAVTGPTRRSTLGSSALSEVGNSVSAVGKSVQEGEAVSKSKSRKQVKGRASKEAESASLSPDSEVVVVPVKRSTRSSSTLLEDGTSIPVGGKPAEAGELVMKAKSLKQAKDHNSIGESTFSILDNEVVAEPVRRSTRSSSTLLLDGTSLPVVDKSVKGREVVRKGKSQKQVKDVGSKGGSTTSLPDSEVAAEPPRRSTRSSSTLLEDGISLPVVRKIVKGSKVDVKGKAQKQVKDDGANGGGSTTTLPDREVAAEPPRRSTRSSSTLLEDATSLPVVGKSVKGGEADMKGKSQKQAKDHGSTGGGSTTSLPESEVIVEPIRRSTRSSPSLLENVTSLPVLGKSVKETGAVRKGKSPKQAKGHALGGGVSTASLSDNEVIVESTRRLTHSSSKLLEDESHLSAVGKSGGPGKQQKDCTSKQGDSTASLLDTETVTTPTRRLTRSSSKCFGNETVSPVVGKLGDTVSQENSCKQPRDHASGRPMLDDRVVTTPTRRSSRSSLKLLEDETLLKTETLGNDNEIRKDKSRKQSKNCALKLGGSTAPVLHNEAVMTSARRSTHSSSKLLEDGILPEIGNLIDENDAIIRKDKSGKKSKNSALKPGCGSTGAMEVGFTSSQRKGSRKAPADSGVMQRQCFPDPDSSLLEDIQNNSYVKGKSSGKKQSNIKQSSHMLEREVDTRRTSIGCHTLEEQDTPSDNKVASSKSSAAIGAAEDISLPGPPTAALSFSVSIAVENTSGEIEFSNDVDDKIISEMRQSPANVQLHKIENTTSFVGALKELDDVRLGSNIKEKQSFMELAIKGKGDLPLNISEGSSEIQENVSREIDTTLEAEGTLESYGDDSSKAHAPVEGELPLNISDNSSEIQENVSRIVDATLESEGTLESYGDDSSKALAPVDPTSIMNVNSGETSVGALDDVDGLTGTESQNITIQQPVSLLSSGELSTIFHTGISAMAHLTKLDSAEEVDVVREDIMTDYGATQITTPRFSHSTEGQSQASDTEASPGPAHEESNLEVEICSATEEGLAGNVTTDISGPILVCKRYEELSPTLNTDASPEVDLEEPESKVKVDGPSEDVVAGSVATKIIDPVTSGIEVCPEAHYDTNVEKSDSGVEVHVANKGAMEDIEAAQTAVSPVSCKSGEVLSPNLEVEICSATEDGLVGNVPTDISGPILVCNRYEELSPTLNTDASPEVDLEEPESKVKVDGPSEDVVAGSVATKIIDAVTSGIEVCPEAHYDTNVEKSDSEVEVHAANKGGMEDIEATKTAVSPVSCKSGEVLSPNLEVEICSATEDGLAGNVPTDISGPILVCKRYEELSPTLNTDASPEVDLEEPESKVKVDGPSEDVVAGSVATKIIDPVTSGIEVCPEAHYDTNVEKSDSEVEVHAANKGGMEDIEATKTAVSPVSCKSGEVLSPTLLNEVSPNIDLTEPDLKVETHAMSKKASSSNDFLGKASATSSKTLEVLVTANRGAGDSSHIQRIFDNEMESCKADLDNILNTQLASGTCDARKILEASAGISDSQLEVIKETWVSSTLSVTVNDGIETEDSTHDVEKNEDDSDLQLEVTKETWVSSTLSVTVNDGIETEDGTNDVEKNEDELRPSSSSDCPAVEAGYIPTCGVIGTTLGCAGSTKQVGIHDLPYVPDSEDSRHLSDQHGGALNVTESLGVDSVDRIPKSAPREHEALERLNGVADILPETANTANEFTDVEFEKGLELGAVDAEEMENIESLESEASIEADNGVADILPETANTANEFTDVEFEKGLELGAVDAEEMENIESLESEASIEGDNDTVTKKENTIELDKFDHFDEVGQTRDVFFLQEVEGSSGELHTSDAHSHPSLENSASMQGEVRFPSLENFSSSTDMENAPTPSLPKMDAISSVEELLNKDNTEKVSVEEKILNNEEFLSPVSFSLLASRKESQDSAMLKENTSSGRSLGLAASPGTNLADSHKVGGNSNDGKEVGAKMELGSPWNVHEELDIEKSQLAALTQSNEEKRTQVSPIKFESVLEAREEHTQLSTSKSMFLIPVDTFKREDYNTRTVYVTAFSEPGSADSDNTNNGNDLVEENSDYNTITPSAKEHSVDHSINISVSGMAQDSVVTGISENSKASPGGDQSLVKERLTKVVADSSTKSQTQGTLECFEQSSKVEKAWVAPGATLMFVEDLFHMDSRVASFVNDGAQVGRVEHHEENLAHDKCENFLEVNAAETLATEEPEFKAIAAPGSSDAESQEASPFECEMSPTAENFSGGSAKPCAGIDFQATLSTEQSEGQEERTVFIQGTSGVSKLTKDEIFTVLDDIKTEGSATVVSKSEKTEITPISKAAKQEELIAENCTELPGTDATHHVVLWDWKESLGTEMRPVGNESKESKFRGTTTTQHALVSPESGAVGGKNTAVQEESINKDEIMAHEYFGDFGWAFSDDLDVGSSHHKVEDVDSQLPTESAQGNLAGHSSKSGIDMNEEQSKSSELDQIEDSKECVQSTPMQLDINVEPCSGIDYVIRNKENTVGLKMDSALRHNGKPKISNSNRQPLQSVRRIKDEH